MPTTQTVEGGAQVRVTPAGFDKLKSVVPGIINDSFSDGFCLPRGDVGGSFVGAEYCHQTQGTCNAACNVGVAVNANGLSITPLQNPQRLRVDLQTSVNMTIPIRGWAGCAFGGCIFRGSCTVNINSPALGGSFDIGLGINAPNGELKMELAGINEFALNLDIDGCGILGDIADVAADLIDDIAGSFVGNFVLDLLTPAINDLIQQLLPQPLGIAGMIDIGSLVAGVSPGTDGFMEGRIVPGGYVNLDNGGMNLGIITALNADEDPTTRTAGLASEPHLCVPPLGAPNFAGLGLGTTFRSAFAGDTFTLGAAGQFTGSPDPTIPGETVDLAMGISETTLDLTGHHLVTSGGMCLGVGTNLIAQLNVGTIGILVPSLAELQTDEGNDPLLLVTRPQKAVDFTIGENTTASPGLTIHLRNLEVDFYAFLFERYTRAFTMELTMNVGINLNFEQQGDTTVIKPELVGISSSEVTVKVLNSQFVAESAQQLESVLPSVFDLVTPLLGSLPDIPVPAFAGLSVNPLKIQKVTTSQDDFLALYAKLGSSPMMRTAAQNDLGMAEVVQKMDAGLPAALPASTGRAKLVNVDTPDPETIRAALAANDGALPSVTFELDRVDSQGRELEWSWSLNNGFWRPYTAGGTLVISDKAFAWQGVYEIGLKSRIKGNYRTVSDVIREKVIIDSVGPRIFVEKMEWDGNTLRVPAWDVVGGRDFLVAFGKVGEDEPSTPWTAYRDVALSREKAAALAQDHNGELVMYAKDEVGNVSIALITPFHGQSGESGCSCETTGTPGAGSLLLIGLVGLGLFGRRRRNAIATVIGTLRRISRVRSVRTLAMLIGVVGLSALIPACSCGNSEAQACETAEDCGPEFCDPGQLPFCIDNTCVCSDDIPAGRIGPYSDVATGGGQIWVSAYASTHGDLVVAQATGAGRIPVEAWEWVDGIPDGPVVVPGSAIRGGIEDGGPDVGMYTSIAVAGDGTPMVSYFDRDTASLKFAAKIGGVWQIHTVQQGTSQIDTGSGGTLVGMYTSMTLRSDDGRPGIGYLAHIVDANGERAEVRYAAAQTQFPTSSADWQTFKVDEAPIPENPNEIYPLPGGLGLFIDSARNPMNQAPVVVYYDRTNGDLKIARFDPQTSQFATPVVLDGSDGVDAGWSPSVTMDQNGVAHVVYVSATGDDLRYTTDAANATKETIDDGYRIVGTTVDGLPKPEYHFVGDDANIILPPGGQPVVAYQDATTQELLYALRGTDGTWNRTSVAGAAMPWAGAYGFFASGALGTTEVVLSSWVIDQPNNDNWVEIFTRPIGIL